MELPIDGRKAPFKPKYLDEETREFDQWTIFGTDISDGTVYITNDNGDEVAVGLTLDQAEALVSARQVFSQAALAIINKGVKVMDIADTVAPSRKERLFFVQIEVPGMSI